MIGRAIASIKNIKGTRINPPKSTRGDANPNSSDKIKPTNLRPKTKATIPIITLKILFSLIKSPI